ncbi:MAG: hypothetical protein KDE35_00060 [Geminicoccaceae bacterium]|nr:hypothetical protein [Geminicoccaceae bacterium]
MAIVLQRPVGPALERLWLNAHLAVDAFCARRREIRRLRAKRAKFLRLTELEDHILDDIGLLRSEVDWAAALPLEMDAARAAQEARKARRRNELARWPRR